MSITDELDEIETKIEKARNEAAKAEARRDAAKAELKKALQEAQTKFGVGSLPALEKRVAELREASEQALEELRNATRDL